MHRKTSSHGRTRSPCEFAHNGTAVGRQRSRPPCVPLLQPAGMGRLAANTSSTPFVTQSDRQIRSDHTHAKHNANASGLLLSRFYYFFLPSFLPLCHSSAVPPTSRSPPSPQNHRALPPSRPASPTPREGHRPFRRRRKGAWVAEPHEEMPAQKRPLQPADSDDSDGHVPVGRAASSRGGGGGVSHESDGEDAARRAREPPRDQRDGGETDGTSRRHTSLCLSIHAHRARCHGLWTCLTGFVCVS